MEVKRLPSCGLEIKANYFIVIALILAAVSTISAQKCLEYGQTVSLTGTIHYRVFAGPPNWKSIRQGDRRETAIILKLASPMCTVGDDPYGYDISHTKITEVQLVIRNDADLRSLRRLMRKLVVVNGNLFGSHTGYHRTAVLLDVSRLSTTRLGRSTAANVKRPTTTANSSARSARSLRR